MSRPPDTFSADAFDETLKIIRKNLHRLSKDAVIRLGDVAGGEKLRTAINAYSFLPCSSDEKCESCWVEKWCVHKDIPSENKERLRKVLDALTSPEIQLYEIAQVTERDKLRLAKWILVAAALIFIGVTLLQIFYTSPATNKVWDYSSVALNSIVCVIIGYYFGSKLSE